MPTVAQHIARRVLGLKYDELPDDVTARAKLCVLDVLGVMIRGATLSQSQAVISYVRSLEAKPECRVVLCDFRTTAAYAAYANGALAHSCEFDDIVHHPGSVVISTALALAERDHQSGRDLLTAIVGGYDVMERVVAPIFNATAHLGWHATKVVGPFAAASTAGRLLGLDEGQLTHAISIAASDASGTTEYDQSGGEVKRLHPGAAARSGVEAALLAGLGMTGPAEVFEGRRGIYRLFGDESSTEFEPFSDDMYGIRLGGFKLYPTMGGFHSALDGIRALQQRHDFTAADVVEIRVGLPTFGVLHGAGIVQPTDCVSAQFSLAFSIGVRLVYGRNDLQDYLDRAMWSDPRVLEVANKVKAYPSTLPELSGNGGVFSMSLATLLGSVVEVELGDGRRLEHYQGCARGTFGNPASDAEIEEKFMRLVAGLIDDHRAEEIVRVVQNLDEVADVADVMMLSVRRSNH